MQRYYTGKTIVLTGASSGIGAAMARVLAPMHVTLVLTARRAAALDALAAEVRAAGSTAHVVPLDLAKTGAADHLADAVASLGLTPDVLIANAGYGYTGAFDDQPPDDLDAMVAVNVASLTSLVRRIGSALPAGGGVLTVASTASFQPIPYMAAYAATKAYVRSLSEALHAEWKTRGVAVTCLCPGPTVTEFGARAKMRSAFFRGGATAERVAIDGLRALARRQRVEVSGAINAVGAVGGTFVPTRVLLPLLARVMRRMAAPS